ncbi:MAG: hypothetical protein AAF551_08315 [Bacteroidota bacterium]
MIKKITLSLTAIAWLIQASACDICGCNMSGLYFGFLPMYKSHFVGLRYSQTTFDAYIDNDGFYFEDEFSTDTYRRVELIGRFSLSNKLQVRYIVPYAVNDMDGSHQNVHAHGFSDPIVMAYYNPFNTGNDFTRTIMHTLLLGGGVKLPLGAFGQQDQGELINPNFQLGSGSLDYVVGLNYTARHRTLGINIESSYKINTANRDDYRFGDQANASANLFYYIETPKLSILPFGGVYYERAAHHTSGEIIEANTGGEAWLGTLGAQLFRNKLMVNLQYQTPISQSFHTDHHASISGKDRFSISVIQNFSFNKAGEKNQGERK